MSEAVVDQLRREVHAVAAVHSAKVEQRAGATEAEASRGLSLANEVAEGPSVMTLESARFEHGRAAIDILAEQARREQERLAETLALATVPDKVTESPADRGPTKPERRFDESRVMFETDAQKRSLDEEGERDIETPELILPEVEGYIFETGLAELPDEATLETRAYDAMEAHESEVEITDVNTLQALTAAAGEALAETLEDGASAEETFTDFITGLAHLEFSTEEEVTADMQTEPLHFERVSEAAQVSAHIVERLQSDEFRADEAVHELVAEIMAQAVDIRGAFDPGQDEPETEQAEKLETLCRELLEYINIEANEENVQAFLRSVWLLSERQARGRHALSRFKVQLRDGMHELKRGEKSLLQTLAYASQLASGFPARLGRYVLSTAALAT